ncbi:HAF repeat-containing protein [Herbaspirillum sp. HC18]|nr:HAF repeat-containing protein [Herbaspirillum sp. HC18]
MPLRHTLASAVLVAFAFGTQAQPVPEAAKRGIDSGFIDGWSIVELPDLPGGTQSNGTGLNDHGDVVGWCAGPSMPNRAFLFSDGRMTDLGTFGGPNSGAAGINDKKTVVGYAYAGPLTVYAFKYDSGSLQILGALGRMNSEATAINEKGDIVGGATLAGAAGTKAFLYANDTLTFLGSLGGTYSIAKAINRTGQIVGQSNAADQAPGHAVLFDKGGAVADLGTLGGRESVATGINDRGEIVGSSHTTMNTDRTPHAFLYKNGVMQDLGTLGGPSSAAEGVNNAGTVVGSSENQDGELRAVVWQNGRIQDLNALAVVAARGWTRLYWARAINDKGQITGTGFINGVSHAFLLTPRSARFEADGGR